MTKYTTILTVLLFFTVEALLVAGGKVRHSRAGSNPLDDIAIRRSLIMTDNNASISVSPTVLGLQGEDNGWVTVEYSNPNASADDWIAVFSPAKFNGSACPVDTGDEKDQVPLICTAPVKFKFANYSSPDYEKTGNGSVKFQLINQRADFSFALFTGGFSNPILIAVSNSVVFSNPKAPVFPRLALGKEWNEMTVTWTSGYDISEALPFVEWSLKGGPKISSPAGTLTFTRGDMCGAPARTYGWRDPGFIHTSFLKELWPNAVYTYKVGHQLFNGTYIWGKKYSFTAPPFPGQNSLQSIVIFGDMGKREEDGSSEYSDTQPASLNTTRMIVSDLDNIDVVFHIGDICYANGYLSQWDQFTAQVQNITTRVPYMLASGNHERDWPNTGGFYDTTDSGGECGVPAQTYFSVPTENKAKYWYSTQYGMFHFCIADSELDWRIGSEQYQFLERCLASVDRQRQPWLIFIAHRVLGYSSGQDYVQQGSDEEPMAREHLQLLWQKYRVDIAFYGHEHNYERTCPVYENQCVSDGVYEYSGTMNGTIHIVAGNGGKELDPFYPDILPQWSLFRDYDWGFVKLTSPDRSSLLVEYKRSSDGNVYDNFTITRDYRDVLACVHDSCPPTTLAS